MNLLSDPFFPDIGWTDDGLAVPGAVINEDSSTHRPGPGTHYLCQRLAWNLRADRGP